MKRTHKTNRPKFTVDQVEQALRAAAGIYTQAAVMLHCAPNTIANYVKRNKRLQRAYDEILDERLDLAETALLKAIGDSDVRAVIFYLKTKGKHRGYTERTEVTGKDGGAISTVDLSQLSLAELSDEELEQIAAGADPSTVLRNRAARASKEAAGAASASGVHPGTDPEVGEPETP